MPAAELSPDEDERLTTLASYGIMDTAPDRRFDELVELAADVLCTPMAALTLVDSERQWFKSQVGLPITQTPRADSFCAHGMLDPDRLLVVKDASRDPRFVDNNLVRGDLHLRFYAGATIRAPNGQPLGALCVLDNQPRSIDQHGRRVLRRLAGQAAALLELHRQSDALQASSTHDPLTGLINRRWFETLLSSAMEGALAGLPCGVIVLDLDHFASVNHRLGQAAGDAVLTQVTRRLQECVRGADVLARLGGDEFGVLVGGPVDLADVTQIATRIEAALDGVRIPGGALTPLKASIGLAAAPIHGLDAPSLLRAAEQALYAVKASGRQAIRSAQDPAATVPLIGPPGTQSAFHSAPQSAPPGGLQTDLDQALASNDLHFHWQPIFSAREARRVGYEALLRWNRAGHGDVPPGTFIPVAEESGLIGRLDAWVLEHACKAAAGWQEPLHVSVNMSAYWFGRAELIRLLRGVLARTGLPPERLVIELTERTLVQHTQATLRCLRELRAMGVRLALDDFGMGYSSFGYLRQFAFDELKLDRDFVRPLGEEARAEAVAKAIVDVGHSMKMAVCAEGVETVEQLRLLQNMGCDLVQGFLLGRPMPVVPPASAYRTADQQALRQLAEAGDAPDLASLA
jgi:diguanylate cyclase (GGDEF)-like protein